MAVEQEDQVVLTKDEERDNSILDEMWRLGARKRDEILGQDYFTRLKEFWNFRLGVTSTSRTPTFRPQIMLSDLHWMVMQEAGDLTDNTPLPVIMSASGERRKDHEKALRGQWYVGDYNLAFMKAALEAQLCGTGVLMMIHDYAGRGGRGNTELRCIDTENFMVDPACSGVRNWQYVMYRARVSIDEIRQNFGQRAARLPKFPSPVAAVPKLGASQGESPDQLRMPPGPMQQMSFGPIGYASQTRTLEYALLIDTGRRVVKEIDGNDSKTLMLRPKTEPMYPHGRLIIRCDRIKLFDGPNPYRKFPFIPVQVHPSRQNFWAPPPIRYVIQLQEIAQTGMRQNVENTVRLNNGMILVNEAAGVNADSILGLPGEKILVKSPEGVERAVKILTPAAFPDSMLNLPDKLLAKMKADYGHDEQRRGATQPGNQSANLYNTSLSQASGITNVRARFMQPAVKLAMEMVYETMLQYQNDVLFPLPDELSGSLQMIEWAGATGNDLADWELLVDPASIKAMSSSTARQYALLLRNAGLLPVEDTLVAIGWPGAKSIADKVEEEQKMQLLSRESSRGAPRKR